MTFDLDLVDLEVKVLTSFASVAESTAFDGGSSSEPLLKELSSL